MPDAEHTTHDGDDRADEVLRKFRKSLTPSGSGGGVALHIDAEVAHEYHLDPDTEVEVDIVEEAGDVSFQIRDIPVGFTRTDLYEFSEQRGWERVDEYETDEEWSVTFRCSKGLVRVEIDSTTHVDGAVVNNVFIHGPAVEVDESLDRYEKLCADAYRNDLRVRVRDSEGLWQRLRSSAEFSTDDAPTDDTFRQLLNASETVTVQLVKEMASLNTTLDEIGDAVDRIQDVVSDYDTLMTGTAEA